MIWYSEPAGTAYVSPTVPFLAFAFAADSYDVWMAEIFVMRASLGNHATVSAGFLAGSVVANQCGGVPGNALHVGGAGG